MLAGVYLARKKDGTVYYRSNITYKSKHISLGSYPDEESAHNAYTEAGIILSSPQIRIESLSHAHTLSFEKIITLINFRDNGIYFGNPIYLHANYFSYYLSMREELKFDIDDLFFYSSHKILRRKDHLYVNDYGMQLTLLSRYGIHNYAVAGRDYYFVNGDPYDLRYSNIKIVNHYFGVTAIEKNGTTRYRVRLHIRGNHTIGTYSTVEKAAVAYNKAADLAVAAGISKTYLPNYVTELTAKEYADLYTKIRISASFQKYLERIKGSGKE